MIETTVNPYISPRYSDIRVQFEVIDINAAEDATASATSEAEISKLNQTHNKEIEISQKIATLEPNYFLLDGSFILPDEEDNGEIGWWSDEISDEDGNINQVLEFAFTEDHSSIGFMIIFDDKANEYASDFTIQVYDADNILIDEDTVIGNNSSKYISEMPVDGYRKVRITFTKTSKSFRRVRVCEVVFGIIEIFDKDNTVELNLLYETSLNADVFSSHELSIVIDNKDRKYNMINPNGIYKYLQQGQVLKAKLGVGPSQHSVEKVNMGKFYYSYSQAEDNSITARITAHDKSYTLVNSRCRLGTTGSWTVNEAVAAVIADSGLDIVTVIPTNIGNRIINKCIPYNLSHRESLRMIAQAAMCTCYFNRDDELVFAELSIAETSVDVLDNDNMIEPARVSDLGRINRVELIVRDDYAETENIYVASNQLSGESERVKTFENPLAYNGQAVADWLLSIEQMRIKYELQERGNPAREITDTVKIVDAYNEDRNTIITKEEYMYNGILSANTEARGNSL
jgi:hypothetical protein